MMTMMKMTMMMKRITLKAVKKMMMSLEAMTKEKKKKVV